MSAEKIYHVRKSFPVNTWFPVGDIGEYFTSAVNYVEFIGETEFTGELVHESDIVLYTDIIAERLEFRRINGKYSARITPTTRKCVMCKNPKGDIISVFIDPLTNLEWFYSKFYDYNFIVPHAKSHKYVSAEELETFVYVAGLLAPQK
jgi:hypothetical protein